jgi:hypothetical protein
MLILSALQEEGQRSDKLPAVGMDIKMWLKSALLSVRKYTKPNE